jgi:hypothetical protein|tara:strand:- start:193 stop:498 length:306 start_codon:yes stop_codon:yes gene_type:complete
MGRRSKFTIEFEKRYGDKVKSRSVSGLAKYFNIKKSILQDAYDRGVGAYKSNPSSVRPSVNSEEQWAMARLYKLILNIKDKKVPKGAGHDGDLVKKALGQK